MAFIRQPIRKHFFAKGLLLCLAWLLPLTASAASDKPPGVFAPLQGYLVSQGLPASQVRQWLRDPLLSFEARPLARLLARPESSLNYSQFLDEKAVERARRFHHQHAEQLSETQRLTGAPPEVVVAILSVESSLGSYTGRHLTFNMLASQAVLDRAQARGKLARAWPRRKLAYFNSPELRQRLKRRAAWARPELAALGRLALQKGVSPYSFRGSVAGALGLCQFVPSSLARFGGDGNADGQVDLHLAPDAIRSVGLFLRAHGWQPGMDQAGQAKVLHAYNRSQSYVQTVLDLARRLE